MIEKPQKWQKPVEIIENHIRNDKVDDVHDKIVKTVGI